MYYLKGTYTEKFSEEVAQQFCEIGSDLYAQRSVEIFRDGRIGYADVTVSLNGTILPEGKFPSENEIWSSEGEFISCIITREEFEEVWEKAVGPHS